MALTRFGGQRLLPVEAVLLCASTTSATTPLATPAAMLVPLSTSSGWPFLDVARLVGSVLYRYDDALASDASLCPGATTSGLAKPSYHDGPRELYGATTRRRA